MGLSGVVYGPVHLDYTLFFKGVTEFFCTYLPPYYSFLEVQCTVSQQQQQFEASSNPFIVCCWTVSEGNIGRSSS